MSKTMYLLFEHASGYGLFERLENEEIAMEAETVEKSVSKLPNFSRTVHLKAFAPFPSSDSALENIKSVSEGLCTEYLAEFLNINLPKSKKLSKAKFSLGVDDYKLASALQEKIKAPCVSNDLVRELLRGIRLHFQHFVKGLQGGEMEQAQLGLSHHFSQHKVKYSLKREDNMVIQSICLLDTVDKDLNSFLMRIREWYSWHFPEMNALIKDGYNYVRSLEAIGNRTSITQRGSKKAAQATLQAILGDSKTVKRVLKAAASSIGFDISDIDMINLSLLAKRYVSLFDYRKGLFEYLKNKMGSCAPNLTAVIGETVGARLISQAGGLINLSKYPASTVQVLGAEKALFRALKTRSNTPKYGLIFHSSFISRAQRKDKGKISRYLANKCAIASRIDCYSENHSNVYGLKLHEQLNDRLRFFETGERPKRNLEVMHSAKIESELMGLKAPDITNKTEKLHEADKKAIKKLHKKIEKRLKKHSNGKRKEKNKTRKSK